MPEEETSVRRVVKTTGKGAHVMVPKAWIGRTVDVEVQGDDNP